MIFNLLIGSYIQFDEDSALKINPKICLPEIQQDNGSSKQVKDLL